MKVAVLGGHLAPALAVISELPKSIQKVFIGRKHALEGDKAESLEYRTITSLDIPFYSIAYGRFQRNFTRHTIPSIVRIPVSFVQAIQLLRRLRPDVVLSFGSYVSVPLSFACHLLKIPLVIHEQTLDAGAGNKFAAKFAAKICISWESSKQFFPTDKVVLTGNPVRSEIKEAKQDKSMKHPLLYVTGGSLGSHVINVLIEKTLDRLVKKYFVVHQTGDAKEYKDFEKLEILSESLNPGLKGRYICKKFVDSKDTGTLMKTADLVISRSGINTVSELLYLEKPAILIPLLTGQKNEQKRNAEFFAKTGLGVVAYQDTLTPEIFMQLIYETFERKDILKTKQDYKKELSEAASRIVDVVTYVGKQKKDQKTT